MAHAAFVNSRKRPKPAGHQDHGASVPNQSVSSTVALQTQDSVTLHDSDDGDAVKKAIMQHAAQLAPNNSLLAQLHAELLARQQLANPEHQDDGSVKAKLEQQGPVPELSLLTYNVW